ncbi:MAG: RNA helicase [Cyanobacteria bacterium P01_H01_bin.121]
MQNFVSGTTRSTPSLDLKQLFPFELDDFQKQAIAALNADSSVVVCAPTGSGKTLIGEYAIYRALAQEQRVFYTTPLKALSNQKLRDFRETFGSERVGLLTGDTSVNRDAPIVVMTTEIFRNMLYGTPIGEVGTSMVGVQTVVLDECHYMNDRARGTVWEESIIYCPPTIQLVALSATIANSDQLTDWIQEVHGPTDLIYSDYRPVPLQFSFCSKHGLFPLLNEKGTDIHPNFKSRLKRQKHSRNGRGGRRQPDAPALLFVISQLRERDMLPAIYFIFSRRGCDQAVDACSQLNLVNEAEAAQIRTQVEEFMTWNRDSVRTEQVEPLYRGIAAHHAGVLPAWKGLVEELFQQGLVKVVFATETLAAGINMPARTTVISSLSKRTDEGHRLLQASEFLQMAGRAGRRGMDTQGYVAAVQTRFEGVKEAGYLATAQADPLVSQFTPSYGMVLNLLQTHTLEEAKELIERSFGRYLAMLSLQPQQAAIANLLAEWEQLQAQLGEVDWKQLDAYEKLRGRLKEEKRLLKILQDQASEVVGHELVMALNFAIAGTLLTLKGEHVKTPTPILATLVTKAPGSGQAPYLICLGMDNRWYVATTHDVVALHAELPRMATVDTLNPPAELPAKPGQTRQGDAETAVVSEQLVDLAKREPLTVAWSDTAPEVQTQVQRVELVRQDLEAHPAHGWGNRADLSRKRRRLDKIESEARDRQTKLDLYAHRHWQEFLALMEILRDFDCLNGVIPTPLGEAVSAIRGDNELWLGLAISSGEFDHLAPHHLAAACQAIVMEVSRPDAWVRYPVPAEVEDALGGLRTIRRRLFQVQHRQQIALPVWFELELTGLTEQWALSTTWEELCENTSLDEGDVVRILRRTLDFLNQIPHVPHAAASLKQNAQRAIQLIDRAPIRDVLAFVDTEN